MLSLNRWKSTLVRTGFLALVSVCFGATCVVSGQVEIGPRSKPPPKKSPARPAKRPAEKPKYKLYEAPDSQRGGNEPALGMPVDGAWEDPVADVPIEEEVVIPAEMFEMVLIEPGTFLMGSFKLDSDDQPPHAVTISKPYYLGKYEVTQEQWAAVTGTSPSKFKGANLPVENVSWDDVQRFLRTLNANTGGGWRLPTEAEWEYACRAGTTGDYAGNLDDMAWYESNSGRATHQVGQKLPNRWGLYDMHGNVWEWCQYVAGTFDGPKIVFRGGCWNCSAAGSRSTARYEGGPGDRHSNLGFRLARTK